LQSLKATDNHTKIVDFIIPPEQHALAGFFYGMQGFDFVL
jgi:hypothetical protein